jgi:HEAT repeat protein
VLQAAPAVGQTGAGRALAGADVPALIDALLANADLSGDIVLGIAARERLAERGQLDPEAVVPAVMTALQGATDASQQDQQRRIALMGVLADIGPGAEEVVPLLRDIATDTNERNDFVRQQAAIALANIGTPDAEAARDVGNALTVEAWLAGADTEGMQQAAEEHAFLIRQELRSPQPTDAIIDASLDVLHAGGARTAAAAPTLLRAWADPRLGAATHDRIDSVLRALGTTQPALEAAQLAPIDILDEIIADTRSPYPLVNSLSMMELGRLGPSPRAVAVLTEALRSGRNPGAAALELGQFGEAARPALPALVQYLDDDENRPNAIIAISRIGDPDGLAVPELRRIVARAGSRHRGLAASALGELEAAEAVADIASALGDNRTHTRILAARALGEIGPRAAEAVPVLAALLEDDDDQVRAPAATALGRIGAAAAPTVPALAELLHTGDASSRQAATTALQAIGTVDANARQALASDAARYADADVAQFRSLRVSAPHRVDNLLRSLPETRRRQLATVVAEDNEFEIAMIGAHTLAETGGDASPHLARLIIEHDEGVIVLAALARTDQGPLARSVIARLREGAATMTEAERARVIRALEAIGQARL